MLAGLPPFSLSLSLSLHPHLSDLSDFAPFLKKLLSSVISAPRTSKFADCIPFPSDRPGVGYTLSHT
jgi:hypothetical protein